jgi:hypothetical protein
MSIKKFIYFHDIIECSILIIQKKTNSLYFLGIGVSINKLIRDSQWKVGIHLYRS